MLSSESIPPCGCLESHKDYRPKCGPGVSLHFFFGCSERAPKGSNDSVYQKKHHQSYPKTKDELKIKGSLTSVLDMFVTNV